MLMKEIQKRVINGGYPYAIPEKMGYHDEDEQPLQDTGSDEEGDEEAQTRRLEREMDLFQFLSTRLTATLAEQLSLDFV